MTIEQLMASPELMENMSDEQLLSYFAPYIKFCRPDIEALKAKKEGRKVEPNKVEKRGVFKGMMSRDALLAKKILEAAKAQGDLGL